MVVVVVVADTVVAAWAAEATWAALAEAWVALVALTSAEDLELVLVQIARLRSERNKGDLDLIHQAVEQGDVLSRLNSAVATNQSSE